MLTVLVTGVGGGGVGRQVVKALRYAGSEYRIIGTDMTEFSLGMMEVDAAYSVPPAGSSDYIAQLLDICRKEKANCLVPGSEPELWALSQSRLRFGAEAVTLLVNPHHVLETCMDKARTVRFLRQNGFCVPWSMKVVEEPREHWWAQLMEYFPVIVKPTVASGGSMNVYVAQQPDEAQFFVRYLKRQGLVPMVQQYVGSYLQEYTVGVLTDLEDGTSLGSLAVRRHITSGLSNRIRMPNRHQDRIPEEMLVVSSGISQGEVGDFPDVRLVCEKVAVALGARGPVNIQCRLHDGKVYIFEINPRFSGTTFVRALVGFNEPDTLIRRHWRQSIEPAEVKAGYVLRGLEEKYVPY